MKEQILLVSCNGEVILTKRSNFASLMVDTAYGDAMKSPRHCLGSVLEKMFDLL